MAAEQSIPVYTNLNELYQNLGTTLNHAERWNHLAEEFVQRFGRKPAYIARAPGRVNLIGEHIDYALFGAFPAAVERDILIACAPRSITISDEGELSTQLEPYQTSGSVIIENLHSKYPRQVFAPSRRTTIKGSESHSEAVHVEGWHLEINPKELRWESYVKAGYYGVLEHYFPHSSGQHPVPVDLLVTGTVPAGSGLSSSAAMVVASTLAFLAVNDKLDDGHATKKLTKGELVMMSMENEKRVGVNSGGLDQAASVISNPGAALYITFFPSLAASPIPLPKGAVFVCANSLVVSDKAVTAKTNYNLRVVETLVGARVLARILGVQLHDTDTKKEKVTYREVLGRFAGEESSELTVDQLAKTLEGMLENLDGLKSTKLVEDGETGVTIDEMIDLSGLTEAEFTETYLSWIEVRATHFQLYKRAKHVFSEALRVLQFRQTCLDVTEEVGEEKHVEVLQRLGELMNESQTSCAELYQCSCPELDELTELARQAGALGSRLTGAGWGGCTVSLVPEAIVDSFIAKVKETYGPYKKLEGEQLGEVIFATKPSSGACVYKFED